MKKEALIGVGLLGIGGVAWYFNNQINMAKKICVKPTAYVIKKLSSQGTIVTLYLDIKNLGAFDLSISTYSLKILAEGQYLATVISQVPFTIMPFSKTEVTLDIVISPKILLQNIGSVLQTSSNWKNIRMSVDGSIKAKKYGLPFKVPVEYDFTLEELTTEDSSESSC